MSAASARDGRETRSFPRLGEITTAIDGEGVHLVVHFTKNQGAPVRYEPDTSVPAAGIREVDLLRKYHRSATELAEALGISAPRSTVLRRHLRIDDDGPHSHGFVLGAVKQRRYSDNAWMPMRNTLETVDMDAVWKAHSPNRGARSWNTCELAGCQAGQA